MSAADKVEAARAAVRVFIKTEKDGLLPDRLGPIPTALHTAKFASAPFERVVNEALGGNPYAHKYLQGRISDLIGEGQAIPQELRKYAVRLIHGDAPHMHAAAANQAQYWMRDQIVTQAVQIALDAGVKLMRSPASRDKEISHSACSIVADAAGLDEGLVYQLWRGTRDAGKRRAKYGPYRYVGRT
jgi:hypothetical protein